MCVRACKCSLNHGSRRSLLHGSISPSVNSRDWKCVRCGQTFNVVASCSRRFVAALDEEWYRTTENASLLGPFYGAIAVPSVTRNRCCCRGHRCAGGVRATVATPGEWRCKTARSGEWAQHFSNASCCHISVIVIVSCWRSEGSARRDGHGSVFLHPTQFPRSCFYFTMPTQRTKPCNPPIIFTYLREMQTPGTVPLFLHVLYFGNFSTMSPQR